MSVFECIVGCRKVFRRPGCHRLSRTIGGAPAEKPVRPRQNAADAGAATGKGAAIRALRPAVAGLHKQKGRLLSRPFRQFRSAADQYLSLIHISEPTRQAEISYAVFCLKK